MRDVACHNPSQLRPSPSRSPQQGTAARRRRVPPPRRLHRALAPRPHHAAHAALDRQNARAAWPATTPPNSAHRLRVPRSASRTTRPRRPSPLIAVASPAAAKPTHGGARARRPKAEHADRASRPLAGAPAPRILFTQQCKHISNSSRLLRGVASPRPRCVAEQSLVFQRPARVRRSADGGHGAARAMRRAGARAARAGCGSRPRRLRPPRTRGAGVGRARARRRRHWPPRRARVVRRGP